MGARLLILSPAFKSDTVYVRIGLIQMGCLLDMVILQIRHGDAAAMIGAQCI